MKPFVASAPGTQSPETVRQFRELQTYLEQLEDRLTPQAALFSAQDVALTDAWQPLVVNETYGLQPGTYILNLTTLATGSNANAEAQFRINDGSVVVTGPIIPVGNNVNTITSDLVVPQDVVFVIEARGLNCAVANIQLSAFRVGAQQQE